MNTRNKIEFIILSLFLSLAVISAGCAGGAMDAVTKARAAIETARQAGAEKYAPVDMNHAKVAFELAEASVREGSISSYSRAEKYAVEAEQRARVAALKATKARLYEEQTPPPKRVAVPAVDVELVRKRYVALARRRIKNSAFSKTLGKMQSGEVELEVWIAPNGKVLQILLVKGSPSSPLALQVLDGIKSLELDPFPPELKDDHIKVVVKIDTTN